MKVILDNIIYYLQKSGGMSVYWSEIISGLLSRQDLEVTFTEPEGPYANMYYETIRRKIDSRLSTERVNAKLLSFLPFRKRIGYKHIFHSSYYRTSRSPFARNVVTIHDFIPELYFKGVKRYFHAFRKRKAIQNAHGIICISQNTYNDLIKFYPAVVSKPIAVIYNGVSGDYHPLENALTTTNDKDSKYILYVGKRFAYKNFHFAVELMNALPGYRFVIVGDSLSPDEIAMLRPLEGRYESRKHPDNRELNSLYNNAHCLLYPSDYEGFGIPVIEAMRAGCPVVGLQSGAVQEVAGNAALLAKELTVPGFAKLIKELENSEARTTLVSRGLAHSSRFSWTNTADDVVAFYLRLYNSDEPVEER